MINIGVVIRILPSLFKKRVIEKHSKFVSQNNRIPEFFVDSNSFVAIQWKNPKLSKAIAITIVEMIVIAAPLTLFAISPKSVNVTLPLNKMRSAPSVAGTASLIPLGLQKISVIVNINENMVKKGVNSDNSTPPLLSLEMS